MEFPGISRGVEKIECVNFRGQLRKGSGISRSYQEKIIWKFHGSWFLTN